MISLSDDLIPAKVVVSDVSLYCCSFDGHHISFIGPRDMNRTEFEAAKERAASEQIDYVI